MKVQEFQKFESRAKNLSPLSVRNYVNHLRYLYCWLAGAHDLDETTTEEIIEFLMSERERGVSARTCNIYLTSFRNYFDYLVRFHGLAKNPAANVDKMKVENMLPMYIPEHIMNDLFVNRLVGKSFKALRSRAAIAVMYMSGARCAEVCNLSDMDLNFVENKIFLYGKGRKQRCVPMCSSLQRILREYMEVRNASVKVQEPALFVTVDGFRLGDRMMRVIVAQALCQVVPRKWCHPHILRHSFATVLMNHGKRIQDISRWLGHVSIATTQRYLTICANSEADNFDIVF